MHAQVSIAPPIVFLTSTHPSGVLSVWNRSSSPQYVELSFKFGYPTADSAGGIKIDFRNEAAARRYSCTSWLTTSASKFVLEPGVKRNINIKINPPTGLRDGAYWTRLITNSKPENRLTDSVPTGVAANIVIELKQITAIMYETGRLKTRVSLGHLRSLQSSKSLDIYTELNRTGNAPFFGKVSIAISNAGGRVVYSDRRLVAVYFNLMMRFSAPLSELPAGNYEAVLNVTSKRPDIPSKRLLEIAPITKTISFAVK